MSANLHSPQKSAGLVCSFTRLGGFGERAIFPTYDDSRRTARACPKSLNGFPERRFLPPFATSGSLISASSRSIPKNWLGRFPRCAGAISKRGPRDPRRPGPVGHCSLPASRRLAREPLLPFPVPRREHSVLIARCAIKSRGARFRAITGRDSSGSCPGLLTLTCVPPRAYEASGWLGRRSSGIAPRLLSA